MTEREWLECGDPETMLSAASHLAQFTPRKQRLCAAAWCRAFLCRVSAAPPGSRAAQFLGFCTEPRRLVLLEAAERYADGVARREEVRAVRGDSGGPYNLYLDATRTSSFSLITALRSLLAAWHAYVGRRIGEVCDVLRDVFGNPDRPGSPAPICLTPTVVSLAHAAYDERHLPSGHLDPTCLAVLSDALEEAGCTDEALLDHLRSPGPHVRGCFAVDLLLGKS